MPERAKNSGNPAACWQHPLSMTTPRNAADLTRRDFIRGSSVASLMGMLGAVELRAETPKEGERKPLAGPKVKLGLIGLGPRGRDVISALQLQPEADMAVVCDHYEKSLKRSAENVPGWHPSCVSRSAWIDFP